MIQKILKIASAILLGILPLFCSSIMGKHSPYLEGNSFSMYIAICIAYALISDLVLWAAIDKELSKQMLVGGILLFLTGSCIAAIFGLAAPPDTSLNMLQHPEREHFRYFILSLDGLLCMASFFFIIKDRWNVFPKWNKWIVVVFMVAMAEMSWEFYHHYHYAEGLRLWIAQGNNAEGFIKNYDNLSALQFAVVGRFFQYTLVAWLGYILLQSHHVRYGSFILTILMSILGLIAASVVFRYGMPPPKNLQIFILFFIPGFPFILLYWLGVALITRPIRKIK